MGVGIVFSCVLRASARGPGILSLSRALSPLPPTHLLLQKKRDTAEPKPTPSSSLPHFPYRFQKGSLSVASALGRTLEKHVTCAALRTCTASAHPSTHATKRQLRKLPVPFFSQPLHPTKCLALVCTCENTHKVCMFANTHTVCMCGNTHTHAHDACPETAANGVKPPRGTPTRNPYTLSGVRV